MNPKPVARPLPAEAADVALIVAKTCAAIGDVSLSWWHEAVRAGRAPKPAIREPHFTRWRLADVRQFWIDRAASSSPAAADAVITHAKKASAQSQVARRARSARIKAGASAAAA